MYALGKIYYHPPSDCHPAIIDTILFAPFPGDPTSRNYTNGVPGCPHPTNCCTRHCLFSRDTWKWSHRVLINSARLHMWRNEDINNCVRYIPLSPFLAFYWLSLSNSCRMDKLSNRWKNVPLPTRHTQVIVIGTCLESTLKDRLCIDVQSLNLPWHCSVFGTRGH